MDLDASRNIRFVTCFSNMNQSLLTNFFKTGKGPAEIKQPMKKRSLNLYNSVTPLKVKQESEDDENIIIISSDEENVEDVNINLSGTSIKSASSDSTIVYTPETPRKRLQNSFVYESPGIATDVSISPAKKAKNHDVSTPATTSKVRPKFNTSPSKKTRFFSPNKQRSVVLKSPIKGQRKLTEFVARKQLFVSDEEERYATACEGVDDKTKFLLKIVNDYLKDDSLKKLLNEASVNLLASTLTIPKPGSKIVCRLFWRKEGWYRREEVKKIAAEEKNESINEDTATEVLKALVESGFLLEGTENNINFQELTSLLLADELKEICKSLGIKKQTKRSAIEALEDFCKRTSISSYFVTSNTVNNSERALKKMIQKAGACYRLSSPARGALERLYHITYLGIGYEPIRERRLELMLINDKIQRETFPIGDRVRLDSASVVFDNRDEFDRYLVAHCLYEDFLTRTKNEEKCLLVRQVYSFYNNLGAEHLIRYKSLPKWLQRFTPPYLYIKLLDEGIKDLKRGKVESNCLLAVEILSSLVQQTFRQHKTAEWLAEQALILHSYLGKPEEAAKVLINGFETDLSEVAKDCMRPRAKLIALQKNITLDDNIRQTLLAFANKETILEGSIPSHHIFKQPKENITKGKAMYETKQENGRVTQGVEEYACSCYILSGEFTHGYHWEGRIISTLFFLLFWDIIYTEPKHGRGIFLSRLQKYPQDLFCTEFYDNRKAAVDAKLRFVHECTLEELLEVMQIVWDGRPENELSGISRDLGWANVKSVSECLGARRVASLCRRLATDYRYAHSGFPDLTLWNIHTKRIKFVEVKSDSDKPSVKQIQWMQYLLENGIETEFCYVGANTTRVKARRPTKKTDHSVQE